jgi:chorismate mutase
MRPRDPEHDPVVRDLRLRITEADRAVLAAVNRRIELVRELREHKLASGWDFVDKGREERLLAVLASENPGPLSEAGLRELFGDLLALTKRELGGPDATPSRSPPA